MRIFFFATIFVQDCLKTKTKIEKVSWRNTTKLLFFFALSVHEGCKYASNVELGERGDGEREIVEESKVSKASTGYSAIKIK